MELFLQKYHEKLTALEGVLIKKGLEKFEQELRQRLDCQVISDYTQYCFEPEYFFNTYLHLTDEGAKMRTELLIQDLKKYLEESDKK